MTGKYIKPVSSDKLVRCEACGELFLKTDIDGQHVRCFGTCIKCQEYFDGLYEFVFGVKRCKETVKELERQATDE